MLSLARNRQEGPGGVLGGTEKVVIAGVWLTVAVTTWGFAGRASWAPAAFTTGAFVTAVLSVVGARRDGRALHRKAFLPLVLLAGYVVAGLLNPSHVRADGGGWVARAACVDWLPSTVDPATTLRKMLPWLAALALGGALRQARLGDRAVRLLWAGLLVHGVVVAGVGAFFYLSGDPKMLGFVRARHGYHFSAFVYRNHWAAYALLLMAIGLGFAFSGVRRWLSGDGGVDRALPGLGAALLVGITIPMPGSRSGTALAVGLLGCAAVGLAFVLRARARSGGRKEGQTQFLRGLALVGFVVGVLVVGGILNREAIQRHWARTVLQADRVAAGAPDLRLMLSRDTIRMAWDKPVWGWGLGSYEYIFPNYQGAYLRNEAGLITTRVVHAHNDWAQLWAELGAVGFSILLVPAAVLGRQAWRSRGWVRRWVIVGVTLVALYAAADFPLHCVAVLLLWTVLLASAGVPDGAEAV